MADDSGSRPAATDEQMWNANHRGTPGDAAYLAKMNAAYMPGPGETAPKYFSGALRLPTNYADTQSDDFNVSKFDYKNNPATKYGYGFVELGANKAAGPQFDQLGTGVKYDRSKAIWDPNYGWIMPTPQAKDTSYDKYGIPILMMLASAGMGAVGMPALATMGVKQFGSLAAGNNPLSGIMDMFSGNKGAPTAGASTQGAGGLMTLLQLLSQGKGG